jgi:hypothetical protein
MILWDWQDRSGTKYICGHDARYLGNKNLLQSDSRQRKIRNGYRQPYLLALCLADGSLQLFRRYRTR